MGTNWVQKRRKIKIIKSLKEMDVDDSTIIELGKKRYMVIGLHDVEEK